MANKQIGLESDIEDALLPKDAAKRLGVAVFTLKNWRVKNFGPPYIKIGWKVKYPRKRLEQWIAEEYVVLVIPSKAA